MKVQVRRIEPAAISERSASDGSSPSDRDAAIWVIEEIGPAGPAEVRRTGVDRWLCLCIAVLGAVVGFGFIGRIGGDGDASGTPRPSVALVQALASPRVGQTPSADPDRDVPLTLASPVEGAMIESTTVDVTGVASRRLGTVHLAVVLGGAVLGWTDVEVPGPGRLTASIPVFAPPVAVQAQLVATVGGTDVRAAAGSTGPALEAVRRSLRLHPGGPIGLWPARLQRSNERTDLIASGYAPVGVGRVHIRVVTQDGRPLGIAAADVKLDEARPGTPGGYGLGLGSFEARVALGTFLGAGPLRVEVDWRDAIGGEWGTAVLTVIVEEVTSPQRKRPGG